MRLGASMKFPFAKKTPAESSSTDSDALNLDPTWNREWADFHFSDGQAALAALRQEGAAIQRWVVTSLMAVNGAAAVALWNVDMSAGPKVGSMAALIVGVVFAILTGDVSANQAPRYSAGLLPSMGYWLEVKASGQRDAGKETANLAALQAVIRRGRRVARSFGYVSLFCFALGVSIAGYGALEAPFERVANSK